MLTALSALATPLPLNRTYLWAEEGDGNSRGIAATEEHGRTSCVNEDGPVKVKAAPAPQQKPSTLVYWSSKENRSKPVRSANPESMPAARSAAAEVRQHYGHDSVRSANARIVAAKVRAPDFAG